MPESYLINAPLPHGEKIVTVKDTTDLILQIARHCRIPTFKVRDTEFEVFALANVTDKIKALTHGQKNN
jgi:hypothetical protein